MELLERLSWNIRFPPHSHAILLDNNGLEQDITQEEWQTLILSKGNFSLEYPFAVLDEINPVVVYETDGLPVTLEDLSFLSRKDFTKTTTTLDIPW